MRLAQAPDLALLKRAQQLRLHARAELGDFVEEQRAAAGILEQARTIGVRAGERAARVAEQLGLDQVVDQRRAVDRAEPPVAPHAARVNRARGQFLARPALAFDDDRKRRRRGADDGVADGGHRRALADQLGDRIARGRVDGVTASPAPGAGSAPLPPRRPRAASRPVAAHRHARAPAAPHGADHFGGVPDRHGRFDRSLGRAAARSATPVSIERSGEIDARDVRPDAREHARRDAVARDERHARRLQRSRRYAPTRASAVCSSSTSWHICSTPTKSSTISHPLARQRRCVRAFARSLGRRCARARRRHDLATSDARAARFDERPGFERLVARDAARVAR